MTCEKAFLDQTGIVVERSRGLALSFPASIQLSLGRSRGHSRTAFAELIKPPAKHDKVAVVTALLLLLFFSFQIFSMCGLSTLNAFRCALLAGMLLAVPLERLHNKKMWAQSVEHNKWRKRWVCLNDGATWEED
jgi:hypothetical protein